MIKLHITNISDINEKFKLQRNVCFSIKIDSKGNETFCILDKPLGKIQKQIDLQEDSVFSIIDTSKSKNMIKIPFSNKAIDYKEKRIVQLITLQHFCTERCGEQIVQYFNFNNSHIDSNSSVYIEDEGLEHAIHRMS